jgi:hypothetical protein
MLKLQYRTTLIVLQLISYDQLSNSQYWKLKLVKMRRLWECGGSPTASEVLLVQCTVEVNLGAVETHPCDTGSVWSHGGSAWSHVSSPHWIMETMKAHPETSEAHPVAMKAHPEASKAHPRTMKAHPGASEAHSGASEAHPGDVEAYPGTWNPWWLRTGALDTHCGIHLISHDWSLSLEQ